MASAGAAAGAAVWRGVIVPTTNVSSAQVSPQSHARPQAKPSGDLRSRTLGVVSRQPGRGRSRSGVVLATGDEKTAGETSTLEVLSSSSTSAPREDSEPPSASSSSASSASSPSSPSTPPPPPPTSGPGPSGGTIAGAAVGFAVSSFLALRVFSGAPTLGTLLAQSIPYDVAVGNGRPTVVEFYADWCEACREMAPSVYDLEKVYKTKLNFVMMNIDNSKWDDEIDQYQVEGIPHFVFLDSNGKDLAQVVGRLPKNVLEADFDALAKGETELPYKRVRGIAGNVPLPVAAPPTPVSPRDHSW